MSSAACLGIDPGLHGALALVVAGALVQVEDMPGFDGRISPELLTVQVESMLPVRVAVLELVGARPGEGATRSFNFGTSYGVVLGVLAALHVPTVLVRPAAWKRAMKLSKDKDLSRLVAAREFPEWAGWFARKMDADRAEAAMLARWGTLHCPELARPPEVSGGPW